LCQLYRQVLGSSDHSVLEGLRGLVPRTALLRANKRGCVGGRMQGFAVRVRRCCLRQVRLLFMDNLCSILSHREWMGCMICERRICSSFQLFLHLPEPDLVTLHREAVLPPICWNKPLLHGVRTAKQPFLLSQLSSE